MLEEAYFESSELLAGSLEETLLRVHRLKRNVDELAGAFRIQTWYRMEFPDDCKAAHLDEIIGAEDLRHKLVHVTRAHEERA